MIKIERIKCGNGNCYILSENGSSILVDTCRTKYRKKVLEVCRKADIKLIVLTHTHVDHCQNAAYIADKLNVPIAVCRKDLDLIKENLRQTLKADTILGKILLRASLKAFREDEIQFFKPAVFIEEGYSLESYGIHAHIIDCSGHTNGSIGIDCGEAGIIVGDALMNMVYPTVSMIYHDYDKMIGTADKISRLGSRTIYFGHGTPCKNKNWVKNK